MSTKNIIGYVLLSAGLLIIILSLYSAYNTFTGKSQPVQVIKMQKTSSQKTNSLIPSSEDIAKMLGEQLKTIIPIDSLLNLVVFSMMISIFIFGGSVITNIGIKLLR